MVGLAEIVRTFYIGKFLIFKNGLNTMRHVYKLCSIDNIHTYTSWTVGGSNVFTGLTALPKKLKAQ